MLELIWHSIKRPLLAIALPQSLPVLELNFTGDTKTYENYVMTSFGMENGILNSLMIYILKISVSAIFFSILIHTRYCSLFFVNFPFSAGSIPRFLLIRSRISILLIQIHPPSAYVWISPVARLTSPAAEFLRSEVGKTGARLGKSPRAHLDGSCHLKSRLKEFCHGHPTMITWESFVTGRSKKNLWMEVGSCDRYATVV